MKTISALGTAGRFLLTTRRWPTLVLIIVVALRGNIPLAMGLLKAANKAGWL